MTKLSGWGANLRVECDLVERELPRDVSAVLDRSGTIARGLGRSYGDQAINAGGQVVGMTKLDRYGDFDERTGTLTCEAGLSLAALLEHFGPRGWFPMITPGTKFVTIGGCIANDVHGKAHHVHGCFSNSVDSMTVLLASGDVVLASRDEHADLFWATFGGMGLVGIVLSATIRLRRIETTYFRKQALRVGGLDEMLTALDEQNGNYAYSVATIDIFATGAKLGRGVLSMGDHAKRHELPTTPRRDPLRISGPPKLRVPFELPAITLNPLTMRALNGWISFVQARKQAFAHYEEFVYPLDFLAHWNRGYGKRGFTQYQFVVPFEDGSRKLREILVAIQSAGERPFLNILKRLGKQNKGLLSFPREGYTFAIDFPIRRNTVELLRRLDAMVRDAGGRIYLAKDSYVEAATARAMYPQFDRWLEVKATYDPDGIFTSNLGRRIGLSVGR
ncbi:MAG: FAD-binding oxidoreductase [Nannocystaceae bacterium]